MSPGSNLAGSSPDGTDSRSQSRLTVVEHSEGPLCPSEQLSESLAPSTPRAVDGPDPTINTRKPTAVIPMATPAGHTGETIPICGLDFDLLDQQGVIDRILDTLADGHGGWVVTPNLDIMRLASIDSQFHDLIRRAPLLLVDGAPVQWAGRLSGHPDTPRTPGASLLLPLAQAAAARGVPLLLLGGREGAAETAAARLMSDIDGLEVRCDCPPWGFENDPVEWAAAESAVAASEGGIVVCGLGAPKQERVISRLIIDFPDTWFLGLGGTIDLAAGVVPRAPEWMQRVGLEWAYRLAREPRRLFRRYLLEDLPFAVDVLLWATRERLAERGRRRDPALSSPSRLSVPPDGRTRTTSGRGCLPARVRGDIIIPAHNEAKVIGRCLDTLLDGLEGSDVRIIVACNGCSDETATVAQTRGQGIEVIELDRASKPLAIRTAEEMCRDLPRIYLDADVELTGTAATALLQRLHEGALAARPPIHYETDLSPWPVKRYYRARTAADSVMRRLWGAGVYGLSPAGRSQFGAYPDVVAEDLWVDEHFEQDEIQIVDCDPVRVYAPRSLADLRLVLRRSYSGAADRRAAENGATATAEGTIRDLRRVAGQSWSEALDVSTYVTLTLMSRADARMTHAHGWERDESSRAAS